MEKQYKNLVDDVEKEFNDSEMSIVHFITTETADRFGDVVRSGGMDDEAFAKNPVVLYGHDYNSLPVGKSLWRKKATRNGAKGVKAKTQFANTDEGRTVYTLWKDGFLNAASIGFMPKEFEPMMKDTESGQSFSGWDFKQWELLEYSIVPVPANSEALRMALQKGVGSLRVKKILEDELKQSDLDALPEKIKEIEIWVKALEEKVTLSSEVLANVEEQLATLEIDQNLLTQVIKDVELLKEKPKSETLARPLTGEDIERLVKGLRGEVRRITGKIT